MSPFLVVLFQLVLTERVHTALSFVAGGAAGLASTLLLNTSGGASTGTIGGAIIASGLLTAVVVKVLDIYWDSRKAKRAAAGTVSAAHLTQSAEMARIDFERDKESYAEGRRMRGEERAFYDARIAELSHEEKIARLRAHAIGNDNTRLQGVANRLIRLLERSNVDVPENIVVENEELLLYLAELENLPAPPRPKARSDEAKKEADDA